jgi:serine/threonine protein kinase
MTLPSMDPAAILEMQRTALAKYRGLLLVLALGYALIFLLSVTLIVYLRRNRTVAFRGDSSAARKLILPAYVPLLVMLMVMAIVYSIFFWVLRALTEDVTKAASAVENEVYYSMRLFFMLIVIVYMYQKSVTTPALKRATLLTFVLSTYTIPVVWLVELYAVSDTVRHWAPQCAHVLIVLGCLWVFVFPPERASKRSLREYIGFVLVFFALYLTYSELFSQGRLDDGFFVAYANILWGALCPLVIWRVLKADTEHWRGLGRRAVALQTLFRQKHRMDERISSRGLHVLIEMHRKLIIDFAVLELKHKIGTGASAVVFNGVLHSKTPVAVKVYSPTELTDEVVAEFSHEAALCGALHHPNIVKFYGMCVCPPTICLVSELCQGSLDDITRAVARRRTQQQQLHGDNVLARQQLMINLNYMIDATRAVAYLHSFAPAFLHRDIKPANFLVDRKCVVKLTDFGESRSLPRECAQRHGTWPQPQAPDVAAMLGGHDDSFVGLAVTDSHASLRRPAMTVRGTAEYMAPELIQGRAGTALYGEAADIFSLAMTLWDILFPLEDKYPHANGNHLKVFEAVLAGQRPPLLSQNEQTPELAELLTRAWDPRPESRPSALSVLTTLEQIHARVSSEVAVVLANAMEKKILITRKGCTTEHTSAGQDLVQKMLEFDMVDSVEESERAGNGLMSAGLLHHARHVLGFECSGEQYMFDEGKLDALAYPTNRHGSPLAPIVEQRRRRASSSYSSASGYPQYSSPLRDEDFDGATAVGDDDATSYGDFDGDSEFSQSVGPSATAGKSKAEEHRDVENASMAAAIGSTVSELLRFGPRRKLSRTGAGGGSGGESTGPACASTSQWTDTTVADPSMCQCKRLGAGLLVISKRGGGGGGAHGRGVAGGGSALNKRFRRGKRAGSNPGSERGADHSELFTTPPGGVSQPVSQRSTLESGLTARLLMSEFTDTYDSLAPTPQSASDVEMGFHVAASTSEDDEDHEDAVHRRRRRRAAGARGGATSGLRPQERRTRSGRRADSNSSSTQDGSSSVESTTVVHPVDLA